MFGLHLTFILLIFLFIFFHSLPTYLQTHPTLHSFVSFVFFFIILSFDNFPSMNSCPNENGFFSSWLKLFFLLLFGSFISFVEFFSPSSSLIKVMCRYFWFLLLYPLLIPPLSLHVLYLSPENLSTTARMQQQTIEIRRRCDECKKGAIQFRILSTFVIKLNLLCLPLFTCLLSYSLRVVVY